MKNTVVFWTNFARRYWEKKPIRFKNFSSPFLRMDEAKVFDWLVAYCDQCRKNQSAPGLKFFIDGNSQYEAEVLELLPVREDRSLLGYHARMDEIFSDYALVCDELLRVGESEWESLREFTQGLYREVGLPAQFTEIGLYLGNYRKTPFGVHIDGCGVLSFPLVGKKRFRVWGPDFVEKNPNIKRTHDYEKYNRYSTALTAQPGDLTYWPSTYWHIAESSGEFSATWSLGIWLEQPTIPFNDEDLISGEITRLPDLLEACVAAAPSSERAKRRDEVTEFWATRLSRRGFKCCPEDKSLDKNSLVYWFRQSNGKIGVAVDGKFFTFNK